MFIRHIQKKALRFVAGLISLFLVGIIYFALQTLGVDTEQLGNVFHIPMFILLLVISYFLSGFLAGD